MDWIKLNARTIATSFLALTLGLGHTTPEGKHCLLNPRANLRAEPLPACKTGGRTPSSTRSTRGVFRTQTGTESAT